MTNKKEKKFEEAMKNIMDGILDSSLKDTSFDTKELKKALKTMMDDGPEDFRLKFYYPIENIIRTNVTTRTKLPAWDKRTSGIVFLFTNGDFIEHNLASFIQAQEGLACYADKSRWLVNSLVKHFIFNDPIDMTISDKCYWKPHFWTSDQWIALFEALVSFFYGDAIPYLTFTKDNWVPLIRLDNPKKSE